MQKIRAPKHIERTSKALLAVAISMAIIAGAAGVVSAQTLTVTPQSTIVASNVNNATSTVAVATSQNKKS